jgi:hypothetical protein
MMLTLDFVAERYGMLPSQVLREGSSIDFVVADAAQGYANFKREAAELRARGGRLGGEVTKPNEEEMLKMIERVKGTNNDSQSKFKNTR